MRLVIIVGLMLCSLMSFGNPDDSVRTKKFRHYFNLGSGMLFCKSCGNSANGVAAPWLIDGVEFKNRWRLGAGVAYNALGTANAIPYFGSLGGDLFGKKNKIFIEFNYGAAVMRVKDRATDYGFKSMTAPVYLQISAGHSWKFERIRFNLHVGYQYLKTITRYEYGQGYYYPSFSSFRYVPASEDEITWSPKRIFFGLSVGI